MNYVRKDQSIKCNCECDYSLKQKVHLEIHTKSKHEVKLSDIKNKTVVLTSKEISWINIGRPKKGLFEVFPLLSLDPSTLYEQIQFHIVVVVE